MELPNADAAIATLPHDTKFALVVRFVERGKDDPIRREWYTTNTPLPSLNYQVGAQGLSIGYLSHNGSVVRIHRDGKMIFEQPIAGLAITYSTKFGWIINGPVKDYLLLQPFLIRGLTPGGIGSKVSAVGGGWYTLFDQLKALGAQVDGPSKKQNATFLIVWLGAVAIISLLVLLFVILKK